MGGALARLNPHATKRPTPGLECADARPVCGPLAGIVGHGLLVGAPLFTILGIIGVIIAYASRGDARGTWLESHVNWLIRTFWWSLLWNWIGWLIALSLIGIPLAWAIWLATTIWVLYRVVKGYLRFHQSQPVGGW